MQGQGFGKGGWCVNATKYRAVDQAMDDGSSPYRADPAYIDLSLQRPSHLERAVAISSRIALALSSVL